MNTPGEPLRPGRYRHFKGGLYEVLGLVRHSETEEELVLYRALYGDGGLWVRPRPMFRDQVIVNGQAVPRFAYLGPVGPGSQELDPPDAGPGATT